MENDLLTAAHSVCKSFWDGQDRSKINLQEAMRELRACVNAELKKRAQADTTTIIKGVEYQ